MCYTIHLEAGAFEAGRKKQRHSRGISTDVRCFYSFWDNREIDKEEVVENPAVFSFYLLKKPTVGIDKSITRTAKINTTKKQRHTNSL